MSIRKTILGAASALACSLALGGAAQASIIPVLTGGPTLVSPGVWQYTYTASLASDQGLVNGSALAIYDFAGYAGGFTTSNANFTLTTPNLAPGFLGGNPLATDDPSTTDLVFTWTDGDFGSEAIHDPIDFTFQVNSTFNLTRSDGFAGMAVINNGDQKGFLAINYGSVAVPGVPESATWAMMILGMGMVGAGLRLRRGRPIAVAA
ncbi:MAG: hypothetical protein JWO33_2093 [Caulobacteraceae bacterium]|nr:hypothetical protein [Caulobacteraceae bacterium]